MCNPAHAGRPSFALREVRACRPHVGPLAALGARTAFAGRPAGWAGPGRCANLTRDARDVPESAPRERLQRLKAPAAHTFQRSPLETPWGGRRVATADARCGALVTPGGLPRRSATLSVYRWRERRQGAGRRVGDRVADARRGRPGARGVGRHDAPAPQA